MNAQVGDRISLETERVAAQSRAYRVALGSFTTGVTIVTTVGENGQDVGLTVNSFNSVSLDPPMVLWSLRKKASNSLSAFRGARRFAVHVLSANQEALSNLFARQGGDRFAGLVIERGLDGVPLLAGCAARFLCRTSFEYEGGDHVILVGEVVGFDDFDRPPLVFHGGGYALAVKRSDDQPATDAEPESNFRRDFLGYLLGVAHYKVSQKVRGELEQRGLSEEDYLVLGLVGAATLPLAAMDEAVRFTGKRLTPAVVSALERRGLLKVEPQPDGPALPRLTEAGRAAVIELAAMAKAAEVDAEADLDDGERQLLKQLLRRLIRDTDPRLP